MRMIQGKKDPPETQQALKNWAITAANNGHVGARSSGPRYLIITHDSFLFSQLSLVPPELLLDIFLFFRR